ncbi:hypothetical protein K0C01_00930 [Salinarchaeum sp. IM2453]|uniref:hypothetical protein n=1 Tax=Salinarchaeum sp. IM2453 TaxID=2862870 RepID=UPI001C839F18|nr:hypothetical protein [Salinarchaeum sp. IM2453]QZA88766.1 hypothetical protein K0C01_00930 [Salinarchaeum sp. IM2453]
MSNRNNEEESDQEDVFEFPDKEAEDSLEEPTSKSRVGPLSDLAAEIDDRTGETESDGEAEENLNKEQSKKPREGPLGDLAATIDERQRDSTGGDGLFDEKSVPEIDTETVWEQLDAESAEEIAAPEKEEVRTISKETYCETCEYFSAPPDMKCSHEGTEIRELVDFEQVVVVNCPIVRQDEELEQL